MKVTTEKLPKSLLALDIELDRDQVEKGLDRAARRISQKVNIPGFRKGKAPRFIVENYYGRAALLEEASEDLVNRSFREALDQTQIEPVGRANLEGIHFDEEPFHFRVTIPVQPTVTIPDYRAIRVPLELPEIADEDVERAMEIRRDKHVVLKEPEEPRPAQAGDELTVVMDTLLDGEPLEAREEGEEPKETTLVLEPKRLVPGLYDGLLGITVDETRDITVHMPDDHENEQVRDKDVVFHVTAKRIQERLLPDWDELPVLEETEGTLDDLRETTRKEMVEANRQSAERATVDAYVTQLVEQTEYDLPDALIEQEADQLLHEQESQFSRYGITLEQMLQFRGQTHDQAVEELKPQGEQRLKSSLALRELSRAEGLSVSESEIDAEMERMLETYDEAQRDNARSLLSNQLRSSVATAVLNQKLSDRLLALATGQAPELAAQPSEAEAETTGDAAGEAAESTQETTGNAVDEATEAQTVDSEAKTS